MELIKLPMLPLRSVTSILFPGVSVQIDVGRKSSIAAIRKAQENNNMILIAYQKDREEDNPGSAKLWMSAIEASIQRVIEIPNENGIRFRIQVFGQTRVILRKTIKEDGYFSGEYEQRVEPITDKISEHIAELAMNIQEIAFEMENVMSFKPALKPISSTELSVFIDRLIYYTPLSTINKISLLSIIDPIERTNAFYVLIKKAVAEQVEDILKEFEKEEPPGKSSFSQNPKTREVNRLSKLAEDAGLSKEADAVVKRELNKLSNLIPQSSEYPLVINYIETLVSLPWNKYTEDKIDLEEARQILDQNQYGLKKPKDRIIEFLAVRKLKEDMKGSILCFSGPPGIGKTMSGKSIAQAMGRKFIRMSVGALQDEAELRGHRRTYVGALPGKIITNLKRAGVKNPVFMLDEVDKMGKGSRGDPAAALLEILDPEQNSLFMDNFLSVGFDLSQVLFIATVNNSRAMIPALRDRMDVIEISGYTPFDKARIAKHYLIPKQKEENGISNVDVTISSKAIGRIIEEHTMEAGVRSLERECGRLMRKLAVKIAMGKETPSIITFDDIPKYLGPPKIHPELMHKNPEVGVTAGLAWTGAGGTLLFIESIAKPGTGKIEITGNLGNVMKESIQLVHSWVKANAGLFDINTKEMNKIDIHVHFPSGAIPKDGPSAGVAISTSIVSLLTGIPVRNDIAVTGEISLRGKVLPIGGVREKILAAHRAGIREVAIPSTNENDLVDLPEEALKDMTIHLLNNLNDAINILLVENEKNEKNVIEENVIS